MSGEAGAVTRPHGSIRATPVSHLPSLVPLLTDSLSTFPPPGFSISFSTGKKGGGMVVCPWTLKFDQSRWP